MCLPVVAAAAPLDQQVVAPSQAQDAALDISAEDSLEYYEKKGLYVARGQARAVRGGMTLEADLLTAHQRKGAAKTKAGAGPDLDLITAEGNVFIHDDKQKIYGDHAVYDLDKKLFKVTGKALKYITAKNVVTANKSLEYYEEKAMAVARGRALATHQGNRIEADTLSATLTSGTKSPREIKKMMAQGSVVIVTKDGDVARSNRAIYDVRRDVAVLLDNVRLKQGETILAGDQAEVDFKTGQSRLLNTGKGRVRVLLPVSGTKSGR